MRSASWRRDGIVGGTYGVLVEDQLITGANQNVVFDAESGKSGEGWFHGRKIVVRGDLAYFATTEFETPPNLTNPESACPASIRCDTCHPLWQKATSPH